MYDAEIISLEMPWMEWGDDVGLWILLEKDGLRDCILGRRELDESVILSVYANFVSGKINQKFEKKKEVWRIYGCVGNKIYTVYRIYYFDDFLNFSEIRKNGTCCHVDVNDWI